MKKILPFVTIALATLPLCITSCKPTEKNYRTAYEAALAKREAATRDDDFDVSRMVRDDLPRRERVGYDSVFVRREALTVYGSEPKGFLLCNVALAYFKMRSNAEAMAQRLRDEDGLDAFLLQDKREGLYVIGASFASLPEAVKWMREFASAHHDFVYVGLPDEPVIEIPLRRK